MPGKRAPGDRSNKAGGSIGSRYQNKVVNQLPGMGGEELLVFSQWYQSSRIGTGIRKSELFTNGRVQGCI